jgi:hypothetical protein
MHSYGHVKKMLADGCAHKELRPEAIAARANNLVDRVTRGDADWQPEDESSGEVNLAGEVWLAVREEDERGGAT